MTDDGTEKEQAAARIDRDKWKVIGHIAVDRDISRADWLREAIDEKLEREHAGDEPSGNPRAVAAVS